MPEPGFVTPCPQCGYAPAQDMDFCPRCGARRSAVSLAIGILRVLGALCCITVSLALLLGGSCALLAGMALSSLSVAGIGVAVVAIAVLGFRLGGALLSKT